MNRVFRRLRRFGKRGRPPGPSTQEGVFSAHTPQDVTSVRAKSARHKKSTADKWNQ